MYTIFFQMRAFNTDFMWMLEMKILLVSTIPATNRICMKFVNCIEKFNLWYFVSFSLKIFPSLSLAPSVDLWKCDDTYFEYIALSISSRLDVDFHLSIFHVVLIYSMWLRSECQQKWHTSISKMSWNIPFQCTASRWNRIFQRFYIINIQENCHDKQQ